jgi:enoyl-CoA hydratase/carnithine racemase
MKLSNLLTLILLVFIGTAVNAQSIKDFKKDIKILKKATNLSESQEAEALAIYTKIVSDIERLEAMNYSDDVYREKRRAIYQGAEFSLAQIFTDEQQDAYTIHQRNIREQRAQQTKKLRKQNASKQDLMDAQVGVKQI